MDQIETPTPTSTFGRNVFAAGAVSFLMDVSSEMVYPLLPLFLTQIVGANMATVGLIEGIAESVASLLRVFSGWLSDKLGKRKILMVAGYGLATLSRPIVALASHWPHVLTARVVDRLGKGIRTAPRDAVIAESVDKRYLARAFSFHRTMDTLGAAVGPALAFFLLPSFNNDFRKIFWISMIPGVLAVITIVLFIQEKKHVGVSSPLPKLTLAHFSFKARMFILIAGLFALGNSSDAFLILKAQQTGISTTMIPLVYLTFNLVYSMSAVPAGIAADRYGRRLVILIGFVLFAFVYAGFARVSNPTHVWILFALYGVFMGLTEGIQKAFLATIIPAEFKATAFGVFATAVGVAMLPASLIGGWLWQHFSPAATFYFGSTMAIISALLFSIFVLPGTSPHHQ